MKRDEAGMVQLEMMAKKPPSEMMTITILSKCKVSVIG